VPQFIKNTVSKDMSSIPGVSKTWGEALKKICSESVWSQNAMHLSGEAAAKSCDMIKFRVKINIAVSLPQQLLAL
jgi:hypothetical protein